MIDVQLRILQRSLALLSVDLDLGQLRALDATVARRHPGGRRPGAARDAVRGQPAAQALEVAAGRVLLVRSKPVRVTASGAGRAPAGPPGRAARRRRRPRAGRRAAGRAARPADRGQRRLAGHLGAAGAGAAGRRVCFDLHREDQEHTSALLRAGTVMAAVTADADPVPGLHARPGWAACATGRWPPAPSPAAGSRGASRRRRSPPPRSSSSTARTTCSTATCAAGRVRARRRPTTCRPRPTTSRAVGLGFGWGMVPDLSGGRRGAELVDLDPDGAVDVVLHWQQWRLRSAALDRVRAAVLDAAASALDQPVRR